MERLTAVGHHLHVLSLTSPVSGVPAMVLRVIPVPRRKAPADVNAENEHVVGLVNSSGHSAEAVCTEGDSAPVSRLAAPSLLRVCRGS
jgi:hypothetical protein